MQPFSCPLGRGGGGLKDLVDCTKKNLRLPLPNQNWIFPLLILARKVDCQILVDILNGIFGIKDVSAEIQGWAQFVKKFKLPSMTGRKISLHWEIFVSLQKLVFVRYFSSKLSIFLLFSSQNIGLRSIGDSSVLMGKPFKGTVHELFNISQCIPMVKEIHRSYKKKKKHN